MGAAVSTERERLSFIAERLADIPDEELTEAGLLIDDLAKFYASLNVKFKQEALNRMNAVEASLLVTAHGIAEKVPGKPTYLWDFDMLAAFVRPLVTPEMWAELVEEVPPPPPQPVTYKANTTRLKSLAKKLGADKGEQILACLTTLDGTPSVRFRPVEGAK